MDWGRVPGLSAELNEVDKTINKALKSKQRFLTETIKELLHAGGKRLRPALVLLSGQFGNYDPDKLIPLAASVEIIHMATLVHDDIIDDAFLRRGKTTVQSKWGKDVAVFTGDYLFSKAFILLTESSSFDSLQKVAQTLWKICEGEVDQFQSRYNVDVTLKQYLKRISFKTAILFALSCQIGAQISECSPKTAWNLRHAGANMGMAFQIIDDILDFEGQQKVVGKPVGNDLVHGVYTLPLVYAMRHPHYGERVVSLLSEEQYTEDVVHEVVDLVHKAGGVEYSRKIAKRYHDKAMANIRALADHPARALLEEMVQELGGRQF